MTLQLAVYTRGLAVFCVLFNLATGPKNIYYGHARVSCVEGRVGWHISG